MNEKESYKNKIDAQLEEWSAEISKLQAKAKKADAEAQIELNKNIDTLQEKKSQLEDKLSQLKKAGEDGWEDIKKGIDSASKSLADAFSSAKSKFD